VEIRPDTKDWTWVLDSPCPECGFDARRPARERLSTLTRQVGQRWRVVMDDAVDVRLRPNEQVWSPLEYACHVRDVFVLAEFRVRLMLDQDDPLFDNWDQDRTAIDEDYSSQDPVAVVDDLVAAASGFADALDSVPDDAWGRRGRRSDGAAFTVDSFARYLAHDPIHHLTDVTQTQWDESSRPD
jgi:hypothetical protein